MWETKPFWILDAFFFFGVVMMLHKLDVLTHQTEKLASFILYFYIALKCNVDPLRSMFSGGAGHRARVGGTVLTHSLAGENESMLMWSESSETGNVLWAQGYTHTHTHRVIWRVQTQFLAVSIFKIILQAGLKWFKSKNESVWPPNILKTIPYCFVRVSVWALYFCLNGGYLVFGWKL